MDRVVTGADGREWSVRCQMEWRPPVTAEDFEHDVSGGARPGYVMLGILAVLIAALVIWMPEGVYVPGWFLLALALVMLFFPLRWALRRPWTVVAETDGLEPEPVPHGRRDAREGDGEQDGDTDQAEAVAEDAEPEYDPYPAERWVGTVRGMFAVRAHMSRAAKDIARGSAPDPTGPLRPVD